MISIIKYLFNKIYKKDSNKASNEEIIDYSILPEKFRILIPFFDNLAISDDDQRVKIIDNMPEEEIENFLIIMKPLINSVDEYLDSFYDDIIPEAALQLQCLGELYAEIANSRQ